ncbi:MAG: rubredoxin [Spirochaetaceae bacterium]|nr:rubredoxin [Spirochaetaceae bacterium]
MQKYVCDLCGYVYDPVLGDKEANIVNGTPFEELPHNWYCPVCGAPKDNFKIVK